MDAAAGGMDADGGGGPGALRLLGVGFARLDLAGARAAILARGAAAPFAYVVTPNADHLVRLARAPGQLGPLYDGAWLRLLDSRVVARAAHAVGLEAPPVVPGSDLTAALLAPSAAGAIARDAPVTVIGLRPAHRDALATATGLTRIAHHEPPMGFERDPAALEAALQFVEAHPARLIFLAVGSPRQEMLAARLAARGRARGTALCIGASLLFLAGAERRAPRLVQRAGMEWAWRLAGDPRRLARRYLVDSPAVLRLLWQEARARRASG